jgi:hypothetical protein
MRCLSWRASGPLRDAARAGARQAQSGCSTQSAEDFLCSPSIFGSRHARLVSRLRRESRRDGRAALGPEASVGPSSTPKFLGKFTQHRRDRGGRGPEFGSDLSRRVALGKPRRNLAHAPPLTGPGGEPNAENAATRPGPTSSYAALPPPPSRSFGHGLQGLGSLAVGDTGESDERGGGQCGSHSSQERPRSLSGPLLPGPETRSLPRGCRHVSRPRGALKRETGASFTSLCFSWRTVKAFRQSNRHSLLGGADLYPARVDSLRLHGSAREPGKARIG